MKKLCNKINPIQFHNLRNLLSTQESKIDLSTAIEVPVNQINAWLDTSNESVPKANSLIKMMKYFDCSCDYLLDLSDIKERPDDIEKLLERLHKKNAR